MKTYVYVSFSGPRGGRRVVTGSRVPDNCDCIASIGREPADDEFVGVGKNKKKALEDGLWRAAGIDWSQIS